MHPSQQDNFGAHRAAADASPSRHTAHCAPDCRTLDARLQGRALARFTAVISQSLRSQPGAPPLTWHTELQASAPSLTIASRSCGTLACSRLAACLAAVLQRRVRSHGLEHWHGHVASIRPGTSQGRPGVPSCAPAACSRAHSAPCARPPPPRRLYLGARPK